MRIGDIITKNNVFLAPMAGITDKAFRTICKKNGAGLVFTEMVSCKGLYHGSKKTEKMLDISEKERPTVVQVFGSDPNIMAFIVEKYLNDNKNIDIIDINMGCPAPKVVKNGYGSALLKNPDLVKRIVRALVEKSKKPITVKIRSGWNYDNINAVKIGKIVQNEGARAITIHGRTREQFYSGKADWNIIRELKENVQIPVIGNGDIIEPKDALQMVEQTGCDAVMIARGSRGNPWIFNRTARLLKNNKIEPEPSYEDKIKMCIYHLDLLTELKGEKIAVKEMRKHVGWYIKGMKNSSSIRAEINTLDCREEMKKKLLGYLYILKSTYN